MVNVYNGTATTIKNATWTKQSPTKLGGYDFYHRILKSPKFVVAPMVDQSELAWRMLCRKYKADLCYSPMFHSNLFANDAKYRKDALQSCEDDRPLIIQFCGNDPRILLEAALLAQDHCDAIDINLGCPQAIAKRGHYGAFLQDEWELLHEIVRTLHENLQVPVTCKIRRFDDLDKTIRYAQMLERAGCQLLTVHGRTREQKGPLTGTADWNFIKKVRENISIPMFSNGNIMDVEDVKRCLQETGVDGVMTAEGNLHNPALFTGQSPKTWSIANEYLNLVEQYPCPISCIRGHLFKLFHHLLNLTPNSALREELAVANNLEKFRNVVKIIQAKYEPYHEGLVVYEMEETDNSVLHEEEEEEEEANGKEETDYNLRLPPWLCQPYVRPAPHIHKQIIAEKERLADNPNRVRQQYFDTEGNEISRKRMKRLRRRLRKPHKPDGKHERNLKNCQQCRNPLGFKCAFRMCRICCREKCYMDNFDCPGHGIMFKTKRQQAQQIKMFNKDYSGMRVDHDVEESAKKTNILTSITRS